ncbi:hypothetical protein CLJU_c08940 [Clostridium ljungdahlii DSM 13528]|uniref:Uncharacterized protein n=1 Tax=Clostridium ljungdahlii (strain ATCC 55383 / DSM 13528 / PETC) TaxID=748727 RepID=D8GPQ3_CLOLD|nr:hypothetical protein CLJU_c08940 [Clostridium ljungdahlii DSM 13528]
MFSTFKNILNYYLILLLKLKIINKIEPKVKIL